ncbi:hypothetical protein Shyhy01_01100 [Streptomyces hygroscopicus subsp. hygroscopicus]|nr:hypothetical protein [Streptomyces hygroscopicus]GLX47160.1 hypothetical protein Shyhy01_01100 [Streptomyces hygroscopicus subsp. hygroscopicus]
MIRKAAAATLVGMALLLSFAGPSTAGAQGKELTCNTGVANEGTYGFAHCVNHTNRAVAFRAKVVCGWEADHNGDWVTLNPGQEGWSGAWCNGPIGTGVGSVDWEEG